MKWLKFLKAAKKRTHDSGVEHGDDGVGHCHSKRRSMQERRERTSIEQWHEARKSRTSIDACFGTCSVTTTERLSLCKAGMTTLINRTYIVIKHLGSGTSGQVKLALNLRSKKLVAIKAVRKGGAAGGLGRDGARSYDGRLAHHHHHHHGGMTTCSSMQTMASGQGGAGAAGAAGGSSCGEKAGGLRGWRSMTPSSILRRSVSSGRASNSGCHISPSPVRCSGVAPAQLQPQPTEAFVREIAILKRLSHPNVVQLLEVIDDPASDCLLLVMGYVEGCTLQPQQLAPGRWEPLPEQSVWRHARDVICGLEYLHAHGVVHGDLKPANFIQDSVTGVVRILDFGSAVLHGRVVGEEGLRGAHVPLGCTPGFRSPESLAAGYRPSFELDMWALGVCLYLWVFGELPFKGSAPFVVYEHIRSQRLTLPDSPRISAQLTDLITGLLDKDPRTRMTVQQVVVHSWTTAQGLAPLQTTSPLVLTARMQHAAATGAPTYVMPQQHQQQQQPPSGASGSGYPSASLPPTHSHWQNTGGMASRFHGGRSSAGMSQRTSSSNQSLYALDGVPEDREQLAGRGATGSPWTTTAASGAGAAGAGSHRLSVASAAPGNAVDPSPMGEPWVGSSTAAGMSEAPGAAAVPPPEEQPWRMSAAAPSRPGSSLGYAPHFGLGSNLNSAVAGECAMVSGAGAGTGALGISGMEAGSGPEMAAAGGDAQMGGSGGGAGGTGRARRNSAEMWELRRSVTDEELQAAISRSDATGSAAVLMESIFSEVTFAAKHQIIRAGDPVDRIYLITAGEVEIYHDLMQDGPDAPCPHKPIIEGLSDPEEELDDPGDFLSIRMLGGSNVTQLERLDTGLLAMTGHERERDRDREAPSYRDRSGHGGSLARAAMNGGAGGANEGSGHGNGHGLAAMAGLAQAGVSSTGHSNLPPGVPLASPPGTGYGLAPAGPVLGGRGGPFERVTGGGGNGNGGGNGSMLARELSGSSLGLFSRAATQTGHLIVAMKGPGDSLGFAGVARGYGGSDSGGEGATAGRRSEGGSRQQPVWSVNVRARSQVTAFSASIESLHKLARMHPQVEPLLRQMVVQQETDLAVAEALRSLRLVGNTASQKRQGAVAAAAAAAAAAASGGAGPATADTGAPPAIATTLPYPEDASALPLGRGSSRPVTTMGGSGSGSGPAGAGTNGVNSEAETDSTAAAGAGVLGHDMTRGSLPSCLPQLPQRLAVYTSDMEASGSGAASGRVGPGLGGNSVLSVEEGVGEEMMLSVEGEGHGEAGGGGTADDEADDMMLA